MPIIEHIGKVVGKRYLEESKWSDLTGLERIANPLSEEMRTAMRVIADHIRMLTFSIADGGIPSNEGRGYVMRRILRRAARFGRQLNMHEPFIYKVVEGVVSTMGNQFPEIKAKQSYIERVIKGEEESFNATLDRGLEVFNQIQADLVISYLKKTKMRNRFVIDEQQNIIFDPTESEENSLPIPLNSNIEEILGVAFSISGDNAFKLYDTYGFPLDLTELMASERGLKVDVGRFNELMEEQRNRSHSGKKAEWAMGPVVSFWGDENVNETSLRNKEMLQSKFDFDYNNHIVLEAHVEDFTYIYRTEESFGNSEYLRGLTLDRTSFYAESGGQVSDTGQLVFDLVDERVTAPVYGITKKNGRIIHLVDKEPGGKDILTLVDTSRGVETQINVPRRHNIERNHTATHIMHEALRRVFCTHSHQQGSLVALRIICVSISITLKESPLIK